MRIGILGTGSVGRALADKLLSHGHEIMLGGRSAESGAEWADAAGGSAASGSFAETADFAELAILAVQGGVARDVAATAKSGLAGKVLIDVSNPLDFSGGFPPTLIEGLNNGYSLGEALQADLPETDVVKTLNTMANAVMVAPEALAEPTEIFIAGNSAEAKVQVAALLAEMGWQAPIDLGGIEASRGLEAFLLLWTRLMGPMGGNGMFNLKLVKAANGADG